jgi:hypothetical protein
MASGFESAESPENLQFERVEPAAPVAGEVARDLGSPASQRCQRCEQPLFGVYFEVDSRLTCAACRDRAEAEWKSGSGLLRFGKALGAGGGAAILGALLYSAIRALTGYELGLIAIVVGVMVGKAVRWGSAGRGGRSYQVLAMLLTYLAIGGSLLPAAFEGMKKEEAKKAAAQASHLTPGPPAGKTAGTAGKTAAPKPFPTPSVAVILVGLGILVLMAASLPIVVGIESPFLLLIVAIGLYEAWKTSRPAVPHIAGPFTLGA